MLNSFYTKSSKDSVCVFKSPDYTLPLLLSFGTGIDKFISFDEPKPFVHRRATINGNIASWKSNVVISGRMTFHPQSLSLSQIREYQNSKGIVKGILSITHPSALIQTIYREFTFTTPFMGANLTKKMDDIEIGFSCLPPQEVSVGAIANALL